MFTGSIKLMALLSGLVLLTLLSCKSNLTENQIAEFPKVGISLLSENSVVSEGLHLDCDFVACPLAMICNYISRVTGVLVSCDSNSALLPISLSVKDKDYRYVLGVLSRIANMDIIPIESGFHIGMPNEGDRVVVSGYVAGYDNQYLNQALSNALPGCTVSVSPDGLAVVSCVPSSVGRVRSAIDNLQRTRKLYRVRLCVIDDWFDTDLLEGSLSIVSDTTMPLRDWYWRGVFGGRVNLSLGGTVVKSVVRSVHDYACLDGDMVRVFRGSKLPVARHTISDSGTNTISGYDDIDVGDMLELSVLSQIDGSIILTINHEVNRLSGYVDTYPKRDSNELRTSVRLSMGSVFCIGDYEYEDRRFGLFRFAWSNKSAKLLVSVQDLTSN